jgi:hypothetical protein
MQLDSLVIQLRMWYENGVTRLQSDLEVLRPIVLSTSIICLRLVHFMEHFYPLATTA